MSGKNWAWQCGWCGMPCDSAGNPMGDEAPKTDCKTEHLHGKCCAPDDDPPRYVTREMALDAGDPDLEGWPM